MGSYPVTAKLGYVVMGEFVPLWISECPRLFLIILSYFMEHLIFIYTPAISI